MNRPNSRHRPHVARLTVVVLLLCSSPVWAIVGRHDRDDAALLKLGQRFESAGRVLPDGGCTLIAPKWAVTAGHVVHSLKPGVGRVRFGKKDYVVKQIIMHPKCKPHPTRPPEVDLALLELSKPVRNVTPTPIYREDDELGKTVFVVGYGDIGDGTSRPRRSNAKRRAATNVIDDAQPTRIMFTFDSPPNGTDLEGTGGPGDSGGPILLEQDGKLYLIGVSSGSMNGKPGRYGVTDVYTRVSAFADWIDGSIKNAQESGK